MERYAIYIPAEGKCCLIQCDDECPMTLNEMEERVGGFIEVAESSLEPTWAREPVDCIHLIVNEDGLLLSLPDNPRATGSVCLRRPVGDRGRCPSDGRARGRPDRFQQTRVSDHRGVLGSRHGGRADPASRPVRGHRLRAGGDQGAGGSQKRPG